LERIVVWNWTTWTNGIPATLAVPHGQVWPVLDSVQFPTANGTLTANFDRVSPDVSSFGRNGFDSAHLPDIDYPNYVPTNGTVYPPELAAIRLNGADGQGGSGELAKYAFSYNGTVDSNSVENGTLREMTLPTGGSIAYHYRSTWAGGSLDWDLETDSCPSVLVQTASPGSQTDVAFPGDFENRLSYFRLQLDNSAAIATRTEKAPGLPDSFTSYCRIQAAPYLSVEKHYDVGRVARQVVVSRPDGNGNTIATRHIFTVDVTPGSPSNSGLELERRYYKDSDVTASPIRSLVFCYDSESGDVTHSCGYKNPDLNGTKANFVGTGDIRRQNEANWYGQNPTGGGDCSQETTPCWQSASSDYDHDAREWKTETKTANHDALKPAGWQSRTTTTIWTPQTGAHWLLKLFTSRQVSDGTCPSSAFPCSTKSTYDFNTSTGFLNSVTKSDPTLGSGSTMTTGFRNDDNLGNPNHTDVSASGSQFGGSPFTTDRTFQSGLLLTRQESGLSPAWKAFDVTRDPASGLIKQSHDPNSLSTVYEYDALVRLTKATPPGEAATTYCYKLVSGGSAYNYVLVNGSGACDGSRTSGWGSTPFEAYQYDGLGRLICEVRRQGSSSRVLDDLTAGSSLVFRQTGYDTAGRPSFVTEWAVCPDAGSFTSCFTAQAPVQRTTYGSYDFLGRARLITAADSSFVRKSFDDTLSIPQISNSDSAELTEMSNVGGQAVVSLSRKDVLGRVVSVSDPAIGTIATVTTGSLGPTTSYDYNVFDKLTRVRVNNTQARTFAYDALGLLSSESHPETGTTTYNSYDARGKTLTWSAGGNSYTATYDVAGRQTLLQVGTTTYQQNIFDVAAPGPTCSFCLGRLSQRIGSNAGASPAYQVTEKFLYSDPTGQGRLSQKTTTVNSSPSVSVTENWLYNTAGLVQNYFHPRASGAPFVVSTGYVSGQPVLVTANGIPVVSSVAYHPYGSLSSYSTGNWTSHDVTTTITRDGNFMPRPGEIWTSGASLNFDTGPFSYDGAGNVRAIGADTFGYDPVSRLTSASLNSIGTQGYQYDVFGNLYKRTDTNPFTLTANAGTNQFTEYLYDLLGNLRNPPGETITYDPLSQATTSSAAGDTWRYYYTGAGERVLKNSAVTGNTFTFRDPGNSVTTEYAGTTAVSRDNVFLGHLLVGSYANIGVSGNGPAWVYYSSDHLGTPRLLTDNMGTTLETRRTWPFGEDVAAPTTPQRLRFATMERDPEGQRYYDHARSHSFGLARFMSPDKLGGKVDDPQSWNRYTYARNNPLNVIDPDGRAGLGTVAYGLKQSIAAMYGLTAKELDNYINFGGGVAAVAGGVAGAAGGGAATISSSVFELAPVARGRLIEWILGTAAGGSLPANFPTIDRFLNGVATSVKSIDLLAKTYQSGSALLSRLTGFVDKLASFSGGRAPDVVVRGEEVMQKVLEVVVPKGATQAQLDILEQAAAYAETHAVTFRLIQAGQ
jgi:RHS repeat-associated protein